MNSSIRHIRIACYALIAKDSGSIASANYLIIKDLLNNGYEIDFYALKGFQNVDDFLSYQNFHYIPISLKSIQSVWDNLEKLPKNGGILYTLWSKISTAIYFNLLKKIAQENHNGNPYDMVLVLGLPNFFELNGVHKISWLQGTLDTEIAIIDKLKDQIISLSGLTEYIKLKLFYMLRSFTYTKVANSSDLFIGGSQWTKVSLELSGLKNVHALPYPIDIELFKPQELMPKRTDDQIRFLWLGRIVPRKRLDLLLDAIALLISENQNVHLTIIGSFAYANGYSQLLDRFKYPERITYAPGINRLDVPNLMSSIDVLVQTSEAEDFGSSVAEALCCGVPVIVGTTNGTKDYIGSSSWVFAEYTVQSLKKTMEVAIESIKTHKEEISRNCRLVAEQEFSTHKVISKFEELYRQNL